MTLAGRVALVTGGTGALGQAVTVRLLAEGATVGVPWIVGREHEALGAVVESLRGRHGRLDILVALVGGFAPGSLLETDRATWDRILQINLTSAFTAARVVAPHMVAAGHGRIVTVGSRAVTPPAGGFIAYTVAKAGVIALTQALAQELKGSGVTVNCVLPSTMDTPANRAAMPDSDRTGWVPVESVADAIAFLVRDDARHVTGALLTV
jgi:NAD(P)-dependent dehydrogenase (short-subunit alcohol dehydrogenase family)